MPSRESHPIPDEKLQQCVKEIEFEIVRKIKGKEDLLEIFKTLTPEENYRPLEAEVRLFFSIRHAACIYYYLVDVLSERTGHRKEVQEMRGAPTSSIQTKLKFISAYSLFVMGSSIVMACEKELRGKDPAKLAQVDTANFKLDAGRGFVSDLKWMFSSYADALRSRNAEGNIIKSPDDLFSVTRDFWKGVVFKATLLLKEDLPADLLAMVEHTTFHYGKFSVTGLSAEDRKEIKVVTWEPVEEYEVIGDRDVTTNCLRMCDRIAFFDSVLQKNPFNEFGGIIVSMLFDGPPGTGKTKRMRMMMTRLSRRAEMVALLYLFKSVTADQIKSEWYGKTAQLVGELLKAVQDPSLLALLFVDDIDLLLTGDRNEPGTSGGDMDIMKALMDFFSGTGTKYMGNYLAVAATNKPTATDDALRQRFVYPAFIKGPQTWEDYADLAALELRKFAKMGILEIAPCKYEPLKRAFPRKLSEIYAKSDLSEKYGLSRYKKGWDDIGAFCEELRKKNPNFTGRPVVNAIFVAKAQAADFEVPEEWFVKPEMFRAKSYEERVAMVKELFKPITTDMILMALAHQFDSEQRYKVEADEKEQERRAKDYVQDKLARDKALELLGDAKNFRETA